MAVTKDPKPLQRQAASGEAGLGLAAVPLTEQDDVFHLAQWCETLCREAFQLTSGTVLGAEETSLCACLCLEIRLHLLRSLQILRLTPWSPFF